MDPDNISIFQSKSQIPKAIKESILRIKFSLYLSLFIKALLPTVSKERNYVQYTFIKMLFLKHYKVKYSVRNDTTTCS